MFLTYLSFSRTALAVVAMAAVCCCSEAVLAATVVWDFDRPDLLPARMEAATASMSFFDYDPSPPQWIADATTFGITGAGGAPPDMVDGPAHYLQHGPLPNYGHCGYAIDHSGFATSRPDGRMEAWTMVFDVYVPEPDNPSTYYNGMFNSDAALADAADWYIGPSGTLGYAGLGNTSYQAITYDQWHRLGLVYDRPNNRATYWVDGGKVYEGPAGTDDRHLLWASGHAGTDLIFQGDNATDSPPNNYTSDISVASFALSDFAYTDAAMQSLAGPSAAGIPLPETFEPSGTLTQFTSPDDLDLDGNFAYAVNVGGAVGYTISGLEFLADQSGITGYTNTMLDGPYVGAKPEFGSGPDIDNLETVLQSVTYDTTSESEVELAVTSGQAYKLQLLFWKAAGPRTFDVSIEGQLVLDEFNPAPADYVALVYTHEFVAEDNVLTVLFEPGTALAPTHFPILSSLTLEATRLTWIPGDTDGDNRVDDADAATLATNWGETDADWAMGDFDGDRLVGPKDAAIMAANWGYGTTEATAAPEPSTLALLAIGTLGLLTRNRGRSVRSRLSRGLQKTLFGNARDAAR
ncbi:MAG: PEP-CTERM sorting domain-containing protein [Pirellulales bacterium]|nr:PEP-CTERM sorting domain-containing protein [Pirellulales bacterium]